MWCEEGPTPGVLPAVIAQPWVAVSGALGMPPVLAYATYNLLNWRRWGQVLRMAGMARPARRQLGARPPAHPACLPCRTPAARLDPQGPIELGNIVCLHNFLGGVDEEWFRCGAGSELLPALQAAPTSPHWPRRAARQVLPLSRCRPCAFGALQTGARDNRGAGGASRSRHRPHAARGSPGAPPACRLGRRCSTRAGAAALRPPPPTRSRQPHSLCRACGLPLPTAGRPRRRGGRASGPHGRAARDAGHPGPNGREVRPAHILHARAAADVRLEEQPGAAGSARSRVAPLACLFAPAPAFLRAGACSGPALMCTIPSSPSSLPLLRRCRRAGVRGRDAAAAAVLRRDGRAEQHRACL
jgi:hypothetical protein